MKNLTRKFTAIASALTLIAAMTFSLGGGVQAATCWQYNKNGFPTSQTPVFNNICGVPGYGDEQDFARIRTSNGDDTSTSNNADYTNAVSSTCTDGTKFDVHTYIHNDAEPQYNNNGSGSSVAHDVQLAMSAQLGKTLNQFTFGSTLTASNAPTASDTATLSCSGEAVELSLVPNTVKIYGGQAYGWTDLSDSAVNGSTKLGNPKLGSGDEWGCWEYRMAVVYQVVVKKVQKPVKSVAVCKAIDVDKNIKNRTVSVTVHGEATNATIVGYKIDFGGGKVFYHQSASYQYPTTGEKQITTYIKVKYPNGETSKWISSSDCATTINFPVIPPHVPPKVPSRLPSTGPAGLASLFIGSTGLGTIGHWFYRRRKFNR